MRKVIIVEGPDESGKTELVNKLAAHYVGSRIVKSPAGRSIEWHSSWNDWVKGFARTNVNVPLILDRTPEISELVYGSVVRNYSRVQDPLKIFDYGWQIIPEAHYIAIVFCRPGVYNPQSEHTSPFGHRVNDYLEKVYGAYEMLYHMLYPERSEVLSYDWHIDPTAINLMNLLDQWMDDGWRRDGKHKR